MKTLCLLASVICLSNCTTKVLTSEYLDHLPQSDGYNPLSIHVEPWNYTGSDEQWHRVTYSWFNRDNNRRAEHLKIRRGVVAMPPGQPGEWGMPLKPVLQNGKIVAFHEKESIFKRRESPRSAGL